MFRLRESAAALLIALAAAAGAAPARAFVWPNVPDQIAKALASGDVSERRLAAQRLADLPPELGLKLVGQALSDPDVEVRIHVAQAAIALRMPKAGDQVMPWLAEGDARLRLAACDVIRASPTDRSVVALGRVLGDPEPHVRFSAASAMGNSGMAEAVSPLLGHLDDQAPEVRAEVARALGRIGDARAVVPLIGKVQDSVSDVRKVVARALGELGDPRAANALMLALQDASLEVRVEAVGSLGRLRSDEATLSIATLIDPPAETDPSMGSYPGARRVDSGVGAAEVRAAALRALGRIGSEQAVKVLVGALAKDSDATSTHSSVRDALVTAGKPAVAALVTTLDGSPSSATAAGAALVLGALKAKEGAPAIQHAMQRGVLGARSGLRALAQIGDASALPAVLEMLDDPDLAVRKEAIGAAMALMEPGKVDGRPVDPATAALKDGATPIDEKIELVRLLGKTGATRAQSVLLPLATAKPLTLKIAALEALGEIGQARSRDAQPSAKDAAAVDKALLDGLNDESADVRFAAAMGLSRAARPEVATELLERLAVAAEQDRGAIGLAISGVLARATDAALATKVTQAIATAPDSARDSLIEGLGRMKGDAAGKALATIGGGSIDERRKAAEALAGHPEMIDAVKKLAADADSGVRANAVWTLGGIGKKDVEPMLIGLLKDPDVAVAGDAAAALGRIAAREHDGASVAKPLCATLSEIRSYPRANALEALSVADARCEGSEVRDLLSRESAESVRIAAADYIAHVVAKDGAKAVDADKRSLIRCASEDRNASVALRCAKPREDPGPPDDIAIYVVPDMREIPEPRSAFSLVRPDGLMRLGVADRRGEVFEFGAPRGVIRLAVPAALAR